MLKVWITGANGQVGTALNQIADPMEWEIMNTDKDEVDITDIEEVTRFGEISRADVIINCSAITDFAQCEADPKAAFKVNALGARNLSITAKKLDAVLVQLSSDDVFDGKKDSPYNEFDKTNPNTIYGKSKLAGEIYVKEFTHKHFIVRSTWVYGEGENFVNTLLKRVKNEEAISVASDQFGSPTSAKELAEFIIAMLGTNFYGTYHATCSGVCSRFEFAQEILRLAGMEWELKAVPTAESDFSSVRPAYAVLDNFILSLDETYVFPEWKEALAEYMKERKCV